MIDLERIGILGGTFDPPHIGHLIIADEVKYALHLDAIWFIPTNIPPHKNKAMTTAEHRLQMLDLATGDNDKFSVNPIEVYNSEISYTIDTIKLLKGHHPRTDFYFIIGADMVEYLPHWKNIDQLMSLIKFVGVMRPKHTLTTTYPIIKITIPTIDISSTEIRRKLMQREPTRYLLPQRVNHYIKEHQLYGSKRSD